MALTKAKKQEVIDEVQDLLKNSKMTVVAEYQGTSVKQMQQLRREARENGSTVKVIKNRLVIKALKGIDTYKDTETDKLTSMLLYAFNSEDEVAPAQSLANFAKKNPSIKFVGGFTSEGKFMEAPEVSELSKLPSKPQMVAGVINTLQSPTRNVISGLKGNLTGILKALEARS